MNTGRPDPDEQVLAAADHLVHPVTGQVDRRVARHPDVASGQCGADQGLAQGGGGAVDRVALGHAIRLFLDGIQNPRAERINREWQRIPIA